MTEISEVSHICRLISSKKFTSLISIMILTCQVGLLGLTLLFCLYEHFQRIGEKHCILSIMLSKPNIAICFLIGLLPGILVIPILTGFIVWPIVLIIHTISMLYKKKKYMPPFHLEIQKAQTMAIEWLLERENAFKEKEFVRALLNVGKRDPKKTLPLEIIQMIIERFETDQKEENLKIKRTMRRKSSRNYNSILYLNRRNSYFYSHSGYIVLTANSIFMPSEFLNHDSSYYAVFSKDVFIFSFLVILQVSLPYWLYRL